MLEPLKPLRDTICEILSERIDFIETVPQKVFQCFESFYWTSAKPKKMRSLCLCSSFPAEDKGFILITAIPNRFFFLSQNTTCRLVSNVRWASIFSELK